MVDIATPLRGLTFAGVDLQRDDLSIFLEIRKGLDELADVRGGDTVVPGFAGRIPRARIADRRELEVGGWVQGVGGTETERLASYQSLADELGALFDPTGMPDTLAGIDWGSVGRHILARPLNLTWGPPDVPGVRECVVSLESVVPDWTVG